MNSATATMVVPPMSGPDGRLDTGAEAFPLVVGGLASSGEVRSIGSGDRSTRLGRRPDVRRAVRPRNRVARGRTVDSRARRGVAPAHAGDRGLAPPQVRTDGLAFQLDLGPPLALP